MEEEVSYRPICDVWILARPKVKYYGAYPAGFLGRARDLLGASSQCSVLHVCSGRVKDYPYSGYGPEDKTMDLNPQLEPTFIHDVTQPFAHIAPSHYILADPPYSAMEASNYLGGEGARHYPKPALLLQNCYDALYPGGRVGFLHRDWPRPPAEARQVAVVGVLMGYGNDIRCFGVWEKPHAS